MTKRATLHRQRSLSPAVEFGQTEIERIRDQVGKLERDSAGHTRRCGEMQAEIEVLKAAIARLALAAPPVLLRAKAPSA